MDFDFSDEQKMLRDQVRRQLEQMNTWGMARAATDGASSGQEDLWKVVVDGGWTAANIPEEFGGLALGPLETCVIAEELGRSLAPGPFASTIYLFAEALAMTGGCPDLVQGIADGTVTGCLAHAEGVGDQINATVSEGKLSGHKKPVIDGDRASHAVVSARESSDVALYVVALDQSGVVRAPMTLIDRTHGAAEITFDGAAAVRLSGDATAALRRIEDRAAVFIAFEQIGLAEHCLFMARDYALERRAFGRPIGQFQAVKHKLADVFTSIELARSHAYHAAWALSTSDAALSRAAAGARLAATEASWQAVRENIQVHGGIGVTWEMTCHLAYRRAQFLGGWLGGPDLWRQRLAGELLSGAS